VLLRNDKVYVTEEEVEPTELGPRLAKKGVCWDEVCLVLKLPTDKPPVL